MSVVWEDMARQQQGFHDPPGSLPDKVHALLRKKILSWAQSLPANSRVLDLGCGRGTLASGLVKLRPDLEVIGMDVSKGMLELAASQAPDKRNPTWLLADASHWPFPDQSLDAVVVLDLLANLELESEVFPLLKEARRVCKRWLLLEIKTPWILNFLLNARRIKIFPQKTLEFGFGHSSLEDKIPVYVHDPKRLILQPGLTKILRPWPLLPAPSKIFVLDLLEAKF